MSVAQTGWRALLHWRRPWIWIAVASLLGLVILTLALRTLLLLWGGL